MDVMVSVQAGTPPSRQVQVLDGQVPHRLIERPLIKRCEWLRHKVRVLGIRGQGQVHLRGALALCLHDEARAVTQLRPVIRCREITACDLDAIADLLTRGFVGRPHGPGAGGVASGAEERRAPYLSRSLPA